MSFLGLDIGTTGCKLVAYDHSGGILAKAYREYPLITPYPGWAELDAENVWLSVKDCISEVTDLVPIDIPQGIAITALGEAVIPVSKEGIVLANGIVSFDNRAETQFMWLCEGFGKETIFNITGLYALPHYTLFKLMWWRENLPELYKNTWKFLCFGDFIGYKLGLKPVIDHTMAARTLAFDIHGTQWSNQILDAARICIDKLPDISPSGSIVGELSHEVSESIGLSKETILVLGGLDQACAALGAGVTESNETLLSLGTVGVIAPVFNKPTSKMNDTGILSMPHVVPGRMISFGASIGCGSILRWYRDEFGHKEKETALNSGKDPYDVIISQVEDEPTNLYLIPHFSGSRFAFEDPASRGVIFGLSLNTKRAEFVRAILEGVAYELSLIRNRFENSGFSISSLRAVGGGAQSDVWMQIIADSMQIPIYSMKVYDAASLGAALLCMNALESSKSISEVADEIVKYRMVINPRAEWVDYHEDRIAVYCNIYERLKDLYPIY